MPPAALSLRAAWWLQPGYVVGEILVGVVAGVAYSFRDDTISALGTSCSSAVVSGCSSAPWVMNALFVVFGVLQACGALLLLSRRPALRYVVVAALWAVAGVASVLVGLLPVDAYPAAHTMVALPVFLCQPLALLLHARLMSAPSVRAVGTVLGAISVAGAVAFGLLLGDPQWSGALERAAIWPAKVWLLLAVLAVHRADRRG